MTKDLVEFLQHAVRLESDAAEGYQRLAAVMRELAQQFAEEESEHVSHLERWLARGSG